MRVHAAACLLACCSLLAASPQQKPAERQDTIVRVAAVVTDRRGEPLTNLKPSEFSVTVDGKPQALESVQLRQAPAEAPRTFAFLLDEFHTDPQHSGRVRESLRRFVETRMRPGDLALVVRPLDPLTRIKPTADRGTLLEAIAKFEGRKGDYTPRTAFERTYMAQAPAAVASARAQIVTSALRAIGSTLAHSARGRSAIVLVGDGFARVRGNRDVPANLQNAIRIANRADAPVYAFAPSAADGPPDPAYAALSALATQTGGALVSGVEALEAGLARVHRDLDAHYVLTYRAAHGDDGRFHSLQVGLTRPGAQVRARGGYLAPAPPETAARRGQTGVVPLRVTRRSPLIQSWSGAVPTTPGRALVTLTWEPAPPRGAIQGRGRPDSVLVTATTPEGTVLFDAPVWPVGSAAGEATDHASFEAPIGPVHVSMKILDDKGVVIDTDTRDVTVPGPRKDSPTIYPPAVLRTRSAREFRETIDNPNAAPVPTREFRRTDRLLLRVPAVDASGALAPVAAVLLNRLRQPMRDLDAMETPSPAGITQFDLPLASLAPGDYSVRLSIPGPSGEVSEYVTFRVIG